MMKNFYMFRNGELKRKDDNLLVVSAEGIKKQVPIEQLKSIYAFGEVTINSSAIQFLAKHEVVTHFFNYYGFYMSSLYPKEQRVSGDLLIKQVNSLQNEGQRNEVAKQFIEAAAFNMHRNLMYYKRKGKAVEPFLEEIETLRHHLHTVTTVPEIMGVEGNIRKTYYQAWNIILAKEPFHFDVRTKRPPKNEINTLISFVNTLMYTTCLSEIYKTPLNPTLSYLHSASDRRFSLCLDISEVFKPLIVDHVIFNLVNHHIITEHDFAPHSNGLYLKDEARKKVVQAFDAYLAETIMHRSLKRKVSYQHLIRLELYKLMKMLNEPENYQYTGFRMWW
ncbi:MAG: type I-B CRISPR-associated endonuclease Cas1b [Culicoidibacterales bacterium]